ncbi:MAG: hypothetical protein CFK49_11580 [Armatimonadetes bacterium JP3_11]|nr:MAG: hypothetical protein CFK49_11580 [Armatimonadetes bacterium JP3_11]OYT73286.1 MAG: hypothetical protein CFK48_01345 [Armatimonadetes bacterium CP1_7O]RMH10677.1 MAG: hypothetical protein D6697_00430 [Armatimonadota bacterium]
MRPVKWSELIRKVIEQNEQVSLQLLYQEAAKHRPLPRGDWKKTLRGVLYREVRRGLYQRIGLGVFALPKYAQQQQQSAYQAAAQRESYQTYLSKQQDIHGAIQGMLLEIGNYLGYRTYTRDKSRTFDGKPLSSLCGLSKVPDFSYPQIVQITSQRDVVWFSQDACPFPKYIYDVENTTDFKNSMTNMSKLHNINARFVLVADERKRSRFEQILQDDSFKQIASRYTFRSYEQVVRFYFVCVEYYEQHFEFLGT